jgi:hypothetical protein
MHKLFFICTIVVGLTCSSFLSAQNGVPITSTESADSLSAMLLTEFWLVPTAIPTPPKAPAVLRNMSSELALQVYHQRVEDQTLDADVACRRIGC